jgi:hypothetical protein
MDRQILLHDAGAGIHSERLGDDGGYQNDEDTDGERGRPPVGSVGQGRISSQAGCRRRREAW